MLHGPAEIEDVLRVTPVCRKLSPQDTFIPLALSRQELADMTGTTIETGLRIMSRWGRDEVVRTEKDGFVILDRRTLEATAQE